ncbi:MAG: hypothetical protein FWC92_07565 [Defluviitaleaceae bacterium]|nr:hypothetical protein [Defluviitaleaceae bacterium]
MNNVISWLIEDKNPAIKYRTLIEICDKSPGDCLDEYAAIWEHKSVIRLFSKQDKNGLWANDSYEYLTACAELGLYKDERLDRYIE